MSDNTRCVVEVVIQVGPDRARGVVGPGDREACILDGCGTHDEIAVLGRRYRSALNGTRRTGCRFICGAIAIASRKDPGKDTSKEDCTAASRMTEGDSDMIAEGQS